MLIIKFVIFGLLGYLLEGIFNRVTMGPVVEKALKKPEKSFFCYSSPYMIAIFGLSAVLISLFFYIPFFNKLIALPIIMLIGGLIVDIIELGSGLLLNKKLGLSIWDYSSSKFNLLGQIDLMHSILWCLITVPIYFTDWFIKVLI